MTAHASPRDILRAYAARQVSADATVRALVEHDDWYVPLHLLDAIAVDRVRHVILPADDIHHAPAESLWIFTDRDAALRAVNSGAPIALGSGITGIELFGALDPIIRTVRVNRGLPTAETLDFQRVAQLPIWAGAVRLERALATRPAGWLDDAATYADYFTLTYHDGELVRLDDFAGMPTAAVLCTAPDAVDGFLGAVPDDLRASLRVTPVSGRQFWSGFGRFAIDAVVINPCGPPDPVVIEAAVGRALERHVR